MDSDMGKGSDSDYMDIVNRPMGMAKFVSALFVVDLIFLITPVHICVVLLI